MNFNNEYDICKIVKIEKNTNNWNKQCLYYNLT